MEDREMPTDDKKEYKDLMQLLSYMGSGPAVLNKLDQLIMKMEDPRLRQATGNMAQFFHSMPEMAHVKKFRLLNFAMHNSGKAGSYKQVADSIYSLQRYCEVHIASQVPQWQLIATAAGWTPPSSSS